MTLLRLLLPGTAEIGRLDDPGSDAVQALADLYAYPDPLPHGGWVRASMVSSVDGAVAGADGLSRSVSTAVDRAAFSMLRGMADVILVGAGTVRAEGYRPPAPSAAFAERRRLAGQTAAPVLAVVAHRRPVSRETGLFEGENRPYVIVPADADVDAHRAVAGADRVLVAGEDSVDVGLAVVRLAALGLRRVLLEGGPHLLGAAVAAARVDEFCLSVSPLVVGGDASRIVQGPPVGTSVRLAHLIEADGTLLSRWLAHQDRHLPGRPVRG